jgi:WD40 repeat protein
MISILVIIVLVVLALIVVLNTNNTKAEYDFDKPIFQQYLSENLKEISGISIYKEYQIISVNDEVGRLFIYDYQKKEIVDTLDFETEGDYEDLVFQDNICYVLRSDGRIIGIDIDSKNIETFDCSHTDVEEYEGLTFELKSNSLLLAAKEMKGEKVIFQFDLKNKKLNKRFTISKEDIKKNGKHGKEFKPSGIAVHPISEEIYVLASAGKKLLVLKENGKIKHQYNLDEDQFPQPEGICFAPNGDLIISSEGKKDLASISYFKYSK